MGDRPVDAPKAEDALRTSEARYRQLVELAPIAVYVHDGRRVLFGNAAFARLVGVADAGAAIGLAVASLVAPEQKALVRERFAALRDGETALPPAEFDLVRADGGRVPVEVMASQCVFAERPAIQVVLVDLTERRRAEQERASLETQLRRAQRMEALGTLAGGIAHDFNNMLAVIVANTTLAQLDLGQDHPVSVTLGDVLLATERARELVRGILTFSRQQPHRREPLRLSAIAREVQRLLRATLPAAVVLSVESPEDEEQVLADRSQIQQALMNLCTNAWHALEEGRPQHIEVRIDPLTVGPESRDVGAGRYVRLSVRDSGRGMDAATLERIFDPFFTTKPPGAGTGLGLSTVHGILKGHQAFVRVESEPGVGSTFALLFPVAGRDAEALEPHGEVRTHRGEGRSVLLLEDEEALITGARQLLERLGYAVSAHTTMEGAMAAFQRAPDAYDVVVTDNGMASGSGLQFARAVAHLRPEVPIILASGFLNDEVRRVSAEVGVRGLLEKPYSLEDLSRIVDQNARRRPRP
ncbi:MAG: PAS domain S-box protein [Myxococcales bacterium]|nr:PAS domain S-box protein [Myxococcales bacterium]